MTTKRFALLTAVLFALCAVAGAQELVFESLPTLPQNGGISTVNVSQTGTIWVTGDGTGSRFIASKDPLESEWQVPSGILRGPKIEDKQLYKNNILLYSVTPFGKTTYYSTFSDYLVAGGLNKTVNMFSKVENGTATFLGADSWPSNGVTGPDPSRYMVPIYSYRGPFPSTTDGKNYFSGRRLDPPTLGVYYITDMNWFASGQGVTKMFYEVFSIKDSNWNILQVWKDSDRSFVAERFPLNPSTLTTEVVRYSPTGDVTILVSSTQSAKVQALECCTLVANPEETTFFVSYKGTDNRLRVAEVKGNSLKEVYISTGQRIVRVISHKGKYVLVATGRYADVYDSLVLVNTETKVSTTMIDTQGVLPLVVLPQKGIGPLLADIDVIGAVYVGLASTEGTKVFKISTKPLSTPQLDMVGLVMVGSKVILTGKNLTPDNTTTTVMVSGQPVTTTKEAVDKLSFIAPTVAGTYPVVARVVGSNQTIDSTSQTLTVVVPTPPTLTLTSDKTSVKSGEQVTLTWNSKDTNTLVINNGIGSVPVAGTRSVTVTETTTFTATASGFGGNATASVTVTVLPKETLVISTVVDGASFLAGSLVPRSYATLFFSSSSGEYGDLAQTGPEYIGKLGRVSVEVGGEKSWMIYNNIGQINFVLPGSLEGQSEASVVVKIDTPSGVLSSTPYKIALVDRKVANFTFPTKYWPDGRPDPNYVWPIATDSNWRKIAPEIGGGYSQAISGESVAFWANGCGKPVKPFENQGSSPSLGRELAVFPSVTIDGKQAQVLWAGYTVGFPGLCQINAVVPSGLSTGLKNVYFNGDNTLSYRLAVLQGEQ
jgi:uncharacterized protein (TIGR03437 family)